MSAENKTTVTSSKKSLSSRIADNSTSLSGIVLLLLLIVSSITSPYFLTAFNLQSLMRDISFMAIVAIGQSLLLLIGDLDLSVGKIASLCGILGGLLMTKAGMNPWLAFIIGILLGAVCGLINGALITYLKINAMVATIGMEGVYSGITLVITKGQAIANLPESITFLGKKSVGIIPLVFLIALILLVVIVFFVTRTHTGRYIYAMGNSADAARIMGIKTNKIRLIAFSLCGLLSSTAGMLYLSRLGSAQATIGTNWPMNSIASCVIGGIALTGGVGNPIGAFLGAGIICIISNIIVLLGVNIYWQDAVSGIVVVVAIALPSIISIIREKTRIKKISIDQ